jgi:hypothetical protein
MSVLFYKVQNRPDYLAYVGEGEDEKQIGRITKVGKEWRVGINAVVADHDALTFSSAQAAKAFIEGWVYGQEEF